jgi:predicted DNA-binding protein
MAANKTKQTARIGRPPAGARAGERVKDYPQLSVRVPPEMKVRLEALSLVRATPQWRVISDAILCYFKDLPTAERHQVERVIRDKAAADQR